MTRIYDKRILTVLMRWDYCDKSLGESGEKKFIYENFKKLVKNVDTFWYDEFTNKQMMENKLLEIVNDTKPDLVFFMPYLDQFSFEFLDKLKNITSTLAWFGDDTWRFDSYSSRYALHFTNITTTNPLSVPKYRRLGIYPILTEWAGEGNLVDDIGTKIEYRHEVSFVGMKCPYRNWFINFLRKSGINVACYGKGWTEGRISFEEMNQIFRTSKINLNISNSINHDLRFVMSSLSSFLTYCRTQKRAEQVKARNFEIPLSGGFQLSNYVVGLERHFSIGNEIAVYSSPEDCLESIHYYLDNDTQRNQILKNSYFKSINYHTYYHRLDKILTELWG